MEQGHQEAEGCLLFARVCWEVGAPFALSHPETSLLWLLPKCVQLENLNGVESLGLDQCPFGGRLQNGLKVVFCRLDLRPLAGRCSCVIPHSATWGNVGSGVRPGTGGAGYAQGSGWFFGRLIAS